MATRTVFSTGDLPVDARLDQWERVIQDALMPLRGRHDGNDFRARLLAGDVGPVRVAETTTPAGECYRTPELIRCYDHERYEVDVVVRGQVVVEQDSRQARLDPGDLAFLDLSRPVRYASSASTRVAVVFPWALLPLRRQDVARLTAIRVAGQHGSGALVSTFARQLPRHLDDYHAGEAVRLGTAVVDLLAAVLASRLDRDPPSDPRRRALVRSIYAYVDANLGDPRLSPASIAAAHHISLRYLHKLFASEPSTVAGWIRQRRLDQCRRDLLDPGKRKRPVHAIATRWGLPDPAHFSRAFKAAYGLAPAEYRAMADASLGS